MNPVMETILKRRSIRKFLDKPIPDEVMDDIVKAALYAPSGRNLQTWRFTVLLDRGKIRQLAKAVEAELDRPGYDMYRPQALVIPSNEKGSPFGREDDACALENIFLAAASHGVGSVWINQLQDICDRPAIRAILDGFGIPADHVVYGMAALGYPDGEIPPAGEKKGEVRIIR